MATSYHRVIQFESSFLKKLLFSILVTVWRFMFCLYLSTVESKKSLNGCLRQVESQFQRFASTVSCRQVDFRCGLLFFSEILSLANTNRKLPDILGELTAIRSTINDRTHSSQHVILTLHIDRDVYECGDSGIVEATAPDFKLQILSSEKQGRSKRGEMHMNSQEDARS
ncbi:uncharacterized protein LOC125581884 isoform X5 [Brassica napus]|uniref:uncharacterized protein LOC125581884 isoform X5 n=1 Tax=Brassica napus TaxID=3708 RepID=UPI002078C919|nr:uncharacterized protein LOC125581884 isoform X5 [Brassica napus]